MIKGVILKKGTDVDPLYTSSILMSNDFSSSNTINPIIALASGGSLLPNTEYFYKIVALTPMWIQDSQSSSQLSNVNLVTTTQTLLYYRLQSKAGVVTLTLSSDKNGQYVVAQGSKTGNGSITLGMQCDSGVYGTATVTYTADVMGSAYYLTIAKNQEVGYEEVSVTTTGADMKINLTCNAVSNAIEYRVYRGTATGIYDGFFSSATNSFTDDGTVTLGFDANINTKKILTILKTYLPSQTNEEHDSKSDRIFIRMDGKLEDITIDVKSVTNQPTWNDGTLQGLTQAERDLNAWRT